MKIIPVLFIASVCFSSCFQNLFEVQTSNTWNKSHIDSIQHSNKTVIVHFRNDIKRMWKPIYDSIQITGELGEYRRLYARENKPSYPGKVNAYKKKDRNIVFGQVHIYVAEDFTGQNSIIINKDNFASTNVYTHDPIATTINHIISIGIIAALIVVTILAVASNLNLEYLAFST